MTDRSFEQPCAADGSGDGRHSRRSFLRIAASGVAAATAVPLLEACGGSGTASSAGAPAQIKFDFAPDPVWSYMSDNGILADFERKNRVRVITTSTWDEFTYFAGGKGDVVSMGTYEAPLLEQKTKIKTVTFGKYNYLRITPLARSGSSYQTLADIPKGSKIGVPSAVSSTLVWGMFAKKLHNLDFRVGGGDFNLVVMDHFVMPERLVRGDLEAALAIPEAAVPFMRKGQIKVMYGGKLPWQIYDQICSCRHKGVMGNNFIATEKWFDANKDKARAFLALWQIGIQKWRQNQAQIIKRYPQDFAVQNAADVAYMQQYLAKNDWFVDSVYMTNSWIAQEKRLYPLMKETGFMQRSAPEPRFEALTPA